MSSTTHAGLAALKASVQRRSEGFDNGQVKAGHGVQSVHFCRSGCSIWRCRRISELRQQPAGAIGQQSDIIADGDEGSAEFEVAAGE